MNLLSRARRPRRAKEWNPGAAVTFIVTLAASGTVTRAARAAGMGRKSAYALRLRDPAFAAAWKAALLARQGDKVEEVDGPRDPVGQGNRSRRSKRTPTRSARVGWRTRDALLCDLLFARLAR